MSFRANSSFEVHSLLAGNRGRAFRASRGLIEGGLIEIRNACQSGCFTCPTVNNPACLSAAVKTASHCVVRENCARRCDRRFFSFLVVFRRGIDLSRVLSRVRLCQATSAPPAYITSMITPARFRRYARRPPAQARSARREGARARCARRRRRPPPRP